MNTTAIPNVGLSIDMQDYNKVYAFIGGADLWNSNYQMILRDIFAPLFPEMEYNSTENTVTASYIENGKELISSSVPLIGGGEKGRKITPQLVDSFKQTILRIRREIDNPKINPDTKAILKSFTLPLPTVAPELYRIVGRGSSARLFIMWGMVKSPETSVLLTDIDPDNFFPMYTVGKSLDLKTGGIAAIALLALSGLMLYTCKDKEVEIVEKTIEKTTESPNGTGISWLDEDKDCEEDVEDIIVRKISAKTFDPATLKVVYYKTGKTRTLKGELNKAETREGEFYLLIDKIPTGTIRYEISIVKPVEVKPNANGETPLTDTDKEGNTVPVKDQNNEAITLAPVSTNAPVTTTDGKILKTIKGKTIKYDGTKLITEDGEEIIIVNGKLQTVDGEEVITAPATKKDSGTTAAPAGTTLEPVEPAKPLTYTNENGSKETVKLDGKEVQLAPVTKEEVEQKGGKVPAKTKDGKVLQTKSGTTVYYDGTKLITKDGEEIIIVNGKLQTVNGEEVITAPAPKKDSGTTAAPAGTALEPVEPAKPLTYINENGSKETVKLDGKEVQLAPVTKEEVEQKGGKVPAKTKDGKVLQTKSGTTVYYDGTKLITDDGEIIKVVNKTLKTSSGEEVTAESPTTTTTKPAGTTQPEDTTNPEGPTQPASTTTTPIASPEEVKAAPTATTVNKKDGTVDIQGENGEKATITDSQGKTATVKQTKENEAVTTTTGETLVNNKGKRVIYTPDGYYLEDDVDKNNKLHIVKGKLVDPKGGEIRAASEEEIEKLRTEAQTQTNETIIKHLQISSAAMPFSVELKGNVTETSEGLTMTLQVTPNDNSVTDITIGNQETSEATITIKPGEKVYIGAKQGDKNYGANYTFAQ